MRRENNRLWSYNSIFGVYGNILNAILRKDYSLQHFPLSRRRGSEERTTGGERRKKKKQKNNGSFCSCYIPRFAFRGERKGVYTFPYAPFAVFIFLFLTISFKIFTFQLIVAEFISDKKNRVMLTV